MAHTYDPTSVIVIFGAIRLTGFMDGSFVTAERNADAWTTKAGAQGDVVRTKNLDRTGTVKVSLQQSSAANDLLSAQARIDELTNFGTQPVQIQDLNGTTLVHATNAWVKKYPNVEFGKELSAREWVFECETLDFTVGGSLT